MNDAPPDPRVDDLRQQLRALGYLDAGVDRFVLGSARDARRPSTIAWLSSGRIGLLAAALLGPAAAIGVAARLPGLITGARDAVVVASYLGVFFGCAVAASAAVVSLAVAWMSRTADGRVKPRARLLSIGAGAFVTAACLIYLTLWWQTANAGFGWSAPVWTGFALFVAAVISVLLGHAVTVTALAVTVAGSVSGPHTPRLAAASWRVTLAAGLFAFVGAAALLVLTARPAAPQPTPDTLTVVPSGVRVRVLAIDGFDAGMFNELNAAGRLPALGAAFGAAHARLTTEGTDNGGTAVPDPARAWTTIATGQPPSVHGVHAIETRRVAGVQGTVAVGGPSPVGAAVRAATDLLRLTTPSLASGTERRQKTMWEVASEAGLRTAVVNWWATWPASDDREPLARIVLTDRTTLRLELGGALDAEIAPSTLYESLRDRWPQLRTEAETRARAALEGDTAVEPDVGAVLRRSAELDAMQLVLAREVSSPGPDLLAVYLPGLDIAQHAILSPQAAGSGASTVAARLTALQRYYVALDRLLAPVLRPQRDEIVFVVTEPGRIEGQGERMLGVSGASARPGTTARGRVTDVMPTILHALGVPISRELAGRPLPLMTDAFTQRYPVRYVASYGLPSSRPAVRHGQPLDQEMIDRLRSLGYVR